jgi:hypothetical protein
VRRAGPLLAAALLLGAADADVEFNNALAEDPHDLVVERVDGTGAGRSVRRRG